MTLNLVLAFLMVFVGGICIALQPPINTALGGHLGSGLMAAMISFGVGFVALVLLNVMSSDLKMLGQLRTAPIWMFAGGLLGAVLVYFSLLNVAKLGSLTMVATIVFGQLIAALVIDKIGFGSLQVQDVSVSRVFAIVLIGVGIVLTRY
ncbi:MAG: DMT family transporter [Pseudomonadota bacterium]